MVFSAGGARPKIALKCATHTSKLRASEQHQAYFGPVNGRLSYGLAYVHTVGFFTSKAPSGELLPAVKCRFPFSNPKELSM